MINLQLLAAIVDTSKLPKAAADKAHLDAIVSITFAILGSIALLMVVIGGLRYVTAQGDPNAVSQAKKTIIYAIVGVLVSLTAYAIVKLVVNGVTS